MGFRGLRSRSHKLPSESETKGRVLPARRVAGVSLAVPDPKPETISFSKNGGLGQEQEGLIIRIGVLARGYYSSTKSAYVEVMTYHSNARLSSPGVPPQSVNKKHEQALQPQQRESRRPRPSQQILRCPSPPRSYS